MLKRTFIATGIAVSLLASSALAAKPDCAKKQQPLHHILKPLELTDGQKQDVRQIMQNAREDRGLYADDMQQLHRQLRSLIQAQHWDADSVTDSVQQQQALQAQLSLQKAQDMNQIWRLLNTAQQTKLASLLAEHKPEDRVRQQHKMLKKLGLTAQQQAEVDKINATMEEQRQRFKASREAFKQAKHALIMSNDFNQQSWQALQQQYADSFIAMEVAKAESRHQIWNLLDEEQQAKLEKKAKSFKHKKGQKRRGKGRA